MTWSRFYAECRREMEFRYGLKRVPQDYYKEMFAPESDMSDVVRSVRQIYKRLQAEGKALR